MLDSAYEITRFYFCLLLLFLHFSGYPLLLWIVRMLRPQGIPEFPTHTDPALLPPLSLVLPTYNEKNFIDVKLENTLTLEYPREKLSLFVVDGGSTDGTWERIERFASMHPEVRLTAMRSPAAGKIPQLNEVLPRIGNSEIVLISDTDTLLSPADALLKLGGYFQANEDTGVVGAWTLPCGENAHPADVAYWDKENRMRYLESCSYAASIVLAPCYAFRRSILGEFPEDCVADDVHVSFASHLKGMRVIYASEIEARECRQPATLGQLFHHKLRKAHAYTTELLRILYRLPYMRKRLKLIYVFKCFQFFYLPWLPGILLIESLILWGRGQELLLLVSFAFFASLLAFTSAILVPPSNRTRGGLSLRSVLPTLQIFTLINLVLIVNFVRFPFWRQGSSYPKTGVVPKRLVELCES